MAKKPKMTVTSEALVAVTRVYEDKSCTLEEAQENLTQIKDEIENFLELLDDDVRRRNTPTHIDMEILEGRDA